MSKQITINSIVGSEPYDVYLCDDVYGGCIYSATINNSDLPFSFLVPTSFENLTTVGVKVIDDNNCEIKNTVNI
jgi:hypothetical protein